jgi:zinc and cadmium transporter
VPGVLATLLFSLSFSASMVYLSPVAAGGFIYIAASDLIPQLHEEPARGLQWAQGLAIVSGVFFILRASVLERQLDHVASGYEQPTTFATAATHPQSAVLVSRP